MPINLIPKFKYSYTLRDTIYALFHIKSETSIDKLYNFFNTDNIYFTNYARTSLTILLKSISKGKILKVGVQPFTCHTIFQAIENANCEICFIDISENFTLDLISLKQNIEKIDILIVTHTFGIPAEIDEIKQILHNKIIIEDCAHSLFSEYKRKPTGTLGDVSIFSFGYGKYPSIGPGGFIVINNKNLIPEFEKFLKKLPAPSFFMEFKNIFKNFIYALSFKKNVYGLFTYPFFKKLDKKFDFVGKTTQKKTKAYISNVNILLKNFSKYKNCNEIQRQNGKYLAKQLNDFIKVVEEKDSIFNYYIFPLLHKERNYIVDVLFENGIESGKHFSKSIEWAKNYGYEESECPNTEKIINEIFTIPVHYYLNFNKLKSIASIIKAAIL